MNVLICSFEYYPYGTGIANVTYNVVKKLEEQGVTCTVATPTGPDIRLGNRALIMRSGIVGISHYWHTVARHLKEDDFDAVWMHQPLFPGKVPFKQGVATLHSTSYGEYTHWPPGTARHVKAYKRFSSRCERRCLQSFPENAIFTGVSRGVCEEIVGMGVDAHHVRYIPNGVDTERFSPSTDPGDLREQFDIPDDRTVVLSVGRFIPQKNPFGMIDLFSALEHLRDDLTLVAVGYGALLEETRAYAAEKGVKNAIFTGKIRWEDMPHLYASADLYMMTSRYEGQPLTLLEALSSGLPCIVSDIPTLRLVKEADAGLVIDPTHPAAAARSVATYLENGISAHAANARRYALENLKWSGIADHYLATFKEVARS
ncbi:glycosyltransferase involved in cell wall biosynthesis [Methanofollis sp. W23]|uniref:glycosyltransferase family 4 protein n=1 Tax=Methanofollis sp. W23 TaxID=2817849 RepID=UPI001AE9E5EB|nr:glycosyltransferase family 4 protein [Methanofollis sp. W23]MBP2146921.1 glycosyltransferase involved in cell wall biosynthesis [Methanofollis sp. W23]